jgi:hypothetical protein
VSLKNNKDRPGTRAGKINRCALTHPASFAAGRSFPFLIQEAFHKVAY